MIDSAIVCCYMTKEHYKYNKNYLQKRKVILEHLDWRRNRVENYKMIFSA